MDMMSDHRRMDMFAGTTNLEILGDLEQRGMCDGSDFDDPVECEIKGVTS